MVRRRSATGRLFFSGAIIALGQGLHLFRRHITCDDEDGVGRLVVRRVEIQRVLARELATSLIQPITGLP